jgi:hypothetical protein
MYSARTLQKYNDQYLHTLVKTSKQYDIYGHTTRLLLDAQG